MEEKELDKKLKHALEDIEKGLLFGEDDGDDEWEPIDSSEREQSVFEQELKK